MKGEFNGDICDLCGGIGGCFFCGLAGRPCSYGGDTKAFFAKSKRKRTTGNARGGGDDVPRSEEKARASAPESGGAMLDRVHHCSHLELAERLRSAGQMVDALIVDAPYSDRTHSGHDLSSADQARFERQGGDGKARKKINYSAWSSDDVTRFVGAWLPLTRGWFVTITDHRLAIHWAAELENSGRYVFAPLPLVEVGSRCRLTGDGPSSWTCWIVVARPKTRVFVTWGTLRGAYLGGSGTKKAVIGGKPMWAMRQIVSDYSRPGDIVCDPCAGGGTTLLAAKLEGRRYIGCDIDANHVEITRNRLRDLPVGTDQQVGLFDGEI